MPQTVQLYRVFFAAPGDVIEELSSVEGIINEWNRQHGDEFGARLELLHWSTHSWPTTGDRPQGLINKQAFDKSDIVVAVFWGKFGSPTGKAASGTEEEIRRGIRMKKQVMVYFSTHPEPNRKPDPKQHSKIEAFKRDLGKKAIYWSYSDRAKFPDAFRNHLAQVMRGLNEKKLSPH